MFKQVVSILKRLMGCQPTAQSLPTEVTVCNSAKTLPAKSTQPSKVARKQPRKSSLAPTKRKPKQEPAPSTKVAAKSGKKKPTARQVAMVSQSKPTGSKSKTPASKTPRHAK